MSFPNLVVLHYTQSDKLQKAIAKHHCPELLSSGEIPVQSNYDSQRRGKIYIKLLSEDRNVLIEDWLEKKKYVLEWSMELKNENVCLGKLRDLEKELFACDDEVIRFTY